MYKIAQFFVGFCALGLCSLSIMAMFDPQGVMDLVAVELNNTDAYSSIRGIYGGVGLTIAVYLAYWAWSDALKGVQFLSVFWGLYALSRIITIFVEGGLGDFGSQWLVIESVCCIIALLLRFQLSGTEKTVKVA